MKRTTLLGGLAVAMLAVTAAISTARPAHALLCCDNAGYSTSHYWFSAPTCSEAQSAFRSAALPEAAAACGSTTLVCGATIPPCYQYNGQWVVDGIMFYGCKYDCGSGIPDCDCWNHIQCRLRHNNDPGWYCDTSVECRENGDNIGMCDHV
jgi:hypothetical protein